MVLDAETRRNLELTETLREAKTEGSLLSVLDKTHTPMGKRLLRSWVNKPPLLDVPRIDQRLDAVQYFFDRGVERREIADLLKQLHDLERLVNRIVSGAARPNDLVALREDLRSFPPELFTLLQTDHKALRSILEGWQNFENELELLENAISDDPPANINNIGLIRPGFSEELDQIMYSSKHAREWINSLEANERQRTGIKTLRVGFNKVLVITSTSPAAWRTKRPKNISASRPWSTVSVTSPLS